MCAQLQQLQLTAEPKSSSEKILVEKMKFEIESHEFATQRFFCFDTGAV
jgi:hypothetical protein